uniref:LOB domain-containing protein n=1 Tax=Ascaris lumbricoides TaxID=6252 RepID=A0A0M3I9R4_ASCLU
MNPAFIVDINNADILNHKRTTDGANCIKGAACMSYFQVSIRVAMKELAAVEAKLHLIKHQVYSTIRSVIPPLSAQCGHGSEMSIMLHRVAITTTKPSNFCSPQYTTSELSWKRISLRSPQACWQAPPQRPLLSATPVD